jgi:hypothetical protein
VLRREVELLRRENQVLREQLRLGPLGPLGPQAQDAVAAGAMAARGAFLQRPGSMQSALPAYHGARPLRLLWLLCLACAAVPSGATMSEALSPSGGP